MPSQQDQGEYNRTQSQQNDEDLLQHGIGVHDEVQAAVRADEANNSHGIGKFLFVYNMLYSMAVISVAF